MFQLLNKIVGKITLLSENLFKWVFSLTKLSQENWIVCDFLSVAETKKKTSDNFSTSSTVIVKEENAYKS
jgi:hypothetical protein